MNRLFKFIPLLLFVLLANAVGAGEAKAYFSADAGLAFQQGATWRGTPYFGNFVDTGVKFNNGYRMDLHYGLDFTNHISLELETGFIHNSIADASALFAADTVATVDIYQAPIMFNAIYHIPVNDKFRPFVGAGVGAVIGVVEISLPRAGVPTQVDYVASGGFQVIAGGTYAANARTDVGVCYKMLYANGYNWGFSGTVQTSLTESLNHSVLLFLKYKF